MALLAAAALLGVLTPLPAGADLQAAMRALAGSDFAEAASRVRPLAESGDVRAQVLLGQILRNPAHPQRMPEEAYRWFERAAERGDAEAQFWLGVMHNRGEWVSKDPEQAVRHWRQAAEAGSLAATASLARAHMLGEGTARDPVEAVRLARASAERGNLLGQTVLAQAYLKGEGGLPRSIGEFLRWTRLAANQGNAPAMEALAQSYLAGTGIPQDYVQSHMWANLAAARGSVRAAKMREELAAKMTPDQVAEAQRSASRWRPGGAAPASPGPALASGWNGGLRRVGTGSGFVVASPGFVLTNGHVVENCTEVRTPTHKAELKVVARDAKLDLALLEGVLPSARAAQFRAGPTPRLGEPIVVAGYPLSDLLSSSLNVTTGTVSALGGPRNNESLFQITAPVQRGNSGGPVLDSSGDVMGVVVSKLNALHVAMVTGDVPQNVNFAIDGSLARAFVEAQGVELAEISTLQRARAPVDAPAKAQTFTLLLECWR